MAGGLDGVLIFHASTGLSCSGCRFCQCESPGGSLEYLRRIHCWEGMRR